MSQDQQKSGSRSIRDKIRKFIIENYFFGVETIKFEDDDSLMKKGIVDSTGILELVNFIEQEFSITVDDDELLPENLDTLNNLSNYIQRKL